MIPRASHWTVLIAAATAVAGLALRPAAGRAQEVQAAASASLAAAPVAPRRAGPPPPAQRITVSFDKTPILVVLGTFSDFSGKSIVAGTDVKGDVTAEIKDQPWDVALAAILRSHGLASQELESGIIQVEQMGKLRDREKTEALVTKQFRIHYIAADSLVDAVKGLLSERGKVTASSGTNTLVVTDGESVVERLAPLIHQLDVKTPQVTIAAKILFVDRTKLEGLGVVYDIKDSQGNQLNTFTPGLVDQNGDGVLTTDDQTSDNVISLGGNSIAALANATNRITGAALQVVTSLVLGRHTLISFLEALKSMSLTDVQAAPVVTVMDNREANIQVGEQTPIRVIDAGAGGGAGGTGQGGIQFPRANVQIKNTGVILNVTPHVTGNQILLDLHAERSQAVPGVGNVGVVFTTQQANTQVLVEDGGTAVVGGLTIIEKQDIRTGIPVLMDIPIIGRLFRSTTKQERKRDLLIMVTPHIVRGS